MGLAFYYSGKIKDAKLLAPLVNEVIEFSKANNYPYQADIFGQTFPQGELSEYCGDQELYGIEFGPEKCEPIFLTFTRDGRLCSPIQFMINGTPEDDYFHTIATKTQYAGAEAHILVIDFLRYLSKKYFSEFELHDDGEYWETQDKKLLKAAFDRFTRATDSFAAMLEMIPKEKGESIEEFIVRMAEGTKEKLDSDAPD